MSAWVIIVGIALIIVGGFAWIKPSKRDVRLANWRRSATEQGLQVKIISFDPNPQATGIHLPIEGTRYRWIDPEQAQEDDTVHWAVTTQKGWYSQGLPEGWYWVHPIAPQNGPPPQVIEAACNAVKALPIRADSIQLIQVNSKSRSIIWTEAKQSFDAAKLLLFLKVIST